MHRLLEEIELDVQELKCTTLAVMKGEIAGEVAKRSLIRLKERLALLERLLGEQPAEFPHAQTAPCKEPEPVEAEVPATPLQERPEEMPPILADRIGTSATLRRRLSLNDSFRFARELFGGDMALMNSTLDTLGAATSFEAAQEVLCTLMPADVEENPAWEEFTELLRKYFG